MRKRILCFLLAGSLLAGCGMDAWAASVNDVKKKQTETKNKLNEVNQSITAIENKRKEVQSQISNLNKDLVETMLTLELLEADLEKKEGEIREAQEEYDALKIKEEEQYESMKLRIQYLYENGTIDYITILLQADSISDFLNKADFAKEVYDYDDQKLTEYQETKELVAEKKVELEEEQAELEEVQEAQQAYKSQLNSQIASAKTKVANFDTELASAQAKAKEYQTTIKEQNALLKKLEEEEKKEAEKKEAAAETGGDKKQEKPGNDQPGNDQPSKGNEAPAEKEDPAPSGGNRGAQIAAYAQKFCGNPYVPGGTSLTNGADCSGFTWAVHQHFGISIPRSSVNQASGGKSVSLSSVQPGDIIYYGYHVGIYIGGGKIIHASTRKTGIKISSYTYRTPICARRYW